MNDASFNSFKNRWNLYHKRAFNVSSISARRVIDKLEAEREQLLIEFKKATDNEKIYITERGKDIAQRLQFLKDLYDISKL